MTPTPEQLLRCFVVCKSLTQMYIPIYLVTVDERIKKLYILAGEDMQILINYDGEAIYL